MHVRVGVEEEFHIVDLRTGGLVSAAPGLLERLPEHTFVREFQQSVVETNSGVHGSLCDLHADLTHLRSTLAAAAEPLGLGVVAAGSAPLTNTGLVDVTTAPRYEEIREHYRAVAEEQLICAAQVHVDVPDRDTGIRAMSVLAPWLPVLLALSASSPMWLGKDTGHASWRTMVMQRWPSSGPAGHYGSAAEYDAFVDALVRSEAIRDPGMVYFDLRPSNHQNTLELRICDSCPRVGTVVAIAGLFRALATEAYETVRRGVSADVPRYEWLRATTWRAARSGLTGPLVDPVSGRPMPAAVVVRGLLERVRGTLEAYGDWPFVASALERELAGGGAAGRIRAASELHPLADVVRGLAAETSGGSVRRQAACHAGCEGVRSRAGS